MSNMILQVRALWTSNSPAVIATNSAQVIILMDMYMVY